METSWVIISAVVLAILVFVGWRWASRSWQLPCPSLLGWALESRFYDRLSGTSTTLERLDLQPGKRILEIGPGPGRLLVPAAEKVQPDGEAVGIDIQSAMIDRLERRAQQAGIGNLTAIHGDATERHVEDESFDLAFLVTTLGEIPDRLAALAQCYRALKPGGVLSVTEIFGDPHYQSRATVARLAEGVGFEAPRVHGHWWFFTANFRKLGVP